MLNPTDLGLLIDDDELYVRTLQRSLSRRGLETRTATGIAEALRVAEEIRPAFALVDLRLGEDSGLTLIRPLRALRADMRILLVTGYASVATAVVRRGRPSLLRRGHRQLSYSRCGAPESRVVGGARALEERSRTRQSFLNKWISPPMLTESLIRNREVSRMRNFD